jgi:hypothetical protein
MTIELDPDEEAAIAAADENPGPTEDAASEEGGEMEYLQELERIDRKLQAVELEKKEADAGYNSQIKALKKKRGIILNEIEAYRLGERGLPLE